MSQPFLGEIKQVGYTFAPVDWAECNGQLITISDNAALFSLLGDAYGGNARTLFGIPSLKGRYSMSKKVGIVGTLTIV